MVDPKPFTPYPKHGGSPMSLTLGFDVYGTLIDTHGVVTALSQLMGEAAPAFSRTWRAKQLEYSFRRGLMKSYVPFDVCTRQALDFTCDHLARPLSRKDKDHLMDQYTRLPAFEDVTEGLAAVRDAGHRLFAFSNGRAQSVDTLLSRAGIDHFFQGTVSVDEVGSFKPDPAVYTHFMHRAQSDPAESWLISSNPFDVLGAISAGMNAAWIRRDTENIFDPWDTLPQITLTTLADLASELETFIQTRS